MKRDAEHSQGIDPLSFIRFNRKSDLDPADTVS